MSNKVKKLDIFIAPVIVTILLLGVYFIKGVYPFGNNTVDYFDLAQSFVPQYTRTWDIYHGYKSALMDWNAGLVTSGADTIGPYVLFPLNFILFFVKRNNILEFMSIFLIIKLFFASLIMSLYMKRRFDSPLFTVFSAILYSTSGFVIQYYTNMYFLDTVLMLPLVMLGLDILIKEGKRVPYILSLFVLSLTGVQLVFMVLVYLFIKGFVLLQESEDKYKNTCKFILSTIAGVMMAGIVIIPGMLTIFLSTRFDGANSNGISDILLGVSCTLQSQKDFMTYGGEIGLAAVLVVLLCGIRFFKKYYSRMLVILALTIPIFVDSVNRIWHGGSYICFPMRFGFILTFELLCFGGEVLFDDDKREFKLGSIALLFGFALIPFVATVLFNFVSYFTNYGIRDLNGYSGYGLIFGMMILFYILIFLGKRSNATLTACLFMAVIQATLGLFGFIAPSKYYSMECDSSYLYKTYETFSGKVTDAPFDRIKDVNCTLNANYGLLSGESVISEFVNGVNNIVPYEIGKLGYSTNSIRMLDQGGTVFSDAFLGVKKIYDDFSPEGELYSPAESDDSGKLYECRYVMSPGVVCSTDNYSNISKEGSVFDYQNALFKDVCDTDEILIKYIDSSDSAWNKSVYNDNEIYTTDIVVDAPSVLYIAADYDADEDFNFRINGENLKIPYLNAPDNYIYPVMFCNGIINGGYYEDETVKFEVYSNTGKIGSLSVGILDIETLQRGLQAAENSAQREIVFGKDGATISLSAERAGTFVLPAGFSDNWKIKVDNVEVQPYGAFRGAFLGFDIAKGEHTVEMKYIPKGTYLGIVATALGVLLLALSCVMDKKKTELPSNSLIAVPYRFYRILVIDFAIIIYVVPILYFAYLIIFMPGLF